MDLASLGRLAEHPPGLIPHPLCRSTRTHFVIFCEDHVGSNPATLLASCFQRREWDSNPRGVATNALAGRRHKPLGHPSKRRPSSPEIAPLGIEPRLSGTRIRRVANYTTGHREPPVGFEPTTPSLRVTCSTN